MNSTTELRRLCAALESQAASDGFLPQFYAGMHRGDYEFVARFYDLALVQNLRLELNIALNRHRAAGGREPDTIAELLPEGTPSTTWLGPWSWWSHPDVEASWIGAGTQNRKLTIPPGIKRLIEKATGVELDED